MCKEELGYDKDEERQPADGRLLKRGLRVGTGGFLLNLA
jgi:hypothetical protein